jgi:hypothetical protein
MRVLLIIIAVILFLAIIAGGIAFLAALEESLTEDMNESILKDKKDDGTDQQ